MTTLAGTAMATPPATKTTTAPATCHSLSRSGSSANVKPAWLLAALAGKKLEDKYQTIAVSVYSEEAPDCFAERAENYYRKRPQLLSLLHVLYHRYISLADRYSQTLLKPLHRRTPSQVSSTLQSDLEDGDGETLQTMDSDAESSLSFQCPPPPPRPTVCADELVEELVARTVENEILQHEISLLDKYQCESTRKIELQSSLLEVLESERMVLLTENSRLGARAATAEEENEGLSAEVSYLRRTAEELSRCVVKLREDHRVCMLGRKIQELQAQIYALEKRNRECYEVMARREDEKAELVRGVCLELERVKAENKRLREEAVAAAARRRPKSSPKAVASDKWWARLRGRDWVICGLHVKTKEP